ncbi:uncharacterized protein LOC111885145 isoform X2 [Lactuca sativa]|uniref:uncharacterized protein LOC111885145 isoform X2 n=2 Tax=Lactuca sativa TaxID=4236 RepID=UPI000CD83297|nr:uncharacterized protein LOC111885145 isoform X2 [Lactuca sativa]
MQKIYIEGSMFKKCYDPKSTTIFKVPTFDQFITKSSCNFGFILQQEGFDQSRERRLEKALIILTLTFWSRPVNLPDQQILDNAYEVFQGGNVPICISYSVCNQVHRCECIEVHEMKKMSKLSSGWREKEDGYIVLVTFYGFCYYV